MPKGNTLLSAMIASLTAVAVAAPAAVAQPIDMQRTAPVQREAIKADLRTEASAYPAYPSPAPKTAQKDLRTENATDSSRKAAPPALPGPPTWPSHPRVLTPPQATATGDGDGGGIDLPVAVIGIAGILALGGGLTVVAMRTRTRTRVAH